MKYTDEELELVKYMETNPKSVDNVNGEMAFIKEIVVKNMEIKKLLKQYENAEISVGKIAEKLAISRDEVLDLFEKYNIDLVDYDWLEEEKNIEKYLNINK